MEDTFDFLPVSREEMHQRSWYYYDFLVVTADAYVDHPSFGTSVIARVLEDAGYRVAILSQPDWHSSADFLAMGKPRYGVFIGGGNLDSMVAHYTAAKKRRSEDLYSPAGKTGFRPDRPTIVYANRAREAFGNIPILIGGLEASLRRFAHYDYWDDSVRRSILCDAPADLLMYGMGERSARQIAYRLAHGAKVETLTDILGTAYLAPEGATLPEGVLLPSYESVCSDKVAYANATRIEYEEHDPVRGKILLQPHGKRTLVVNPPAPPLTTQELDAAASMPYTRKVHPMYKAGVPAIEEVKFSITHNRGCFGGCNFCAIAFHQGRMITSRSHESVLTEAEMITQDPDFKGYIHDVGGPTANFRHVSCKGQLKHGMCKNRNCLAPTPCKNLDPDHSDYLALLRKLRAIPKVKKVFVRSGIRYDYLLQEKNSEFFSDLVKYHVSGQLKVAPEHCVSSVLDYMGKPHFDVFEKFWAKYQKLNDRQGKEQYLVPYLMSSHPGCTLQDAVKLAEFLHKTGHQPEQVQDFYPTPGTISTCMYYTGIDPWTMKPVYVARDPHEKALQRALLQWRRPELRRLVTEALYKAGREDLIGYSKDCLIRPLSAYKKPDGKAEDKRKSDKGFTEGKRNAPAKSAEKHGRGEGKRSAEKRGKADTNQRPDSRKPAQKGQKAPMSAAKKEKFARQRKKK